MKLVIDRKKNSWLLSKIELNKRLMIRKESRLPNLRKKNYKYTKVTTEMNINSDSVKTYSAIVVSYNLALLLN